MNEDLIKNKIREFLAEKNHVSPEEISGEKDLFASNMLDSLGVIQLIALIETLSGHKIDSDTARYEDFGSVDSIYRQFFAQLTDQFRS